MTARYRAVRTLARCAFYSSIALLALALMSLDSPVLH